MRVLVATTAGSGHFAPLVPFARALAGAGHDVLVAAPGSFAGAVTGAGFAHHPVADAAPEDLAAVFARLPHLPPDEANAVVVGEIFAGLDAMAARPGIEAAVRGWRPDLVLRETSEFASYVVAEAAGIPHAEVACGLRAIVDLTRVVVDAPLAALGAQPGLAALRGAPTLSLAPVALDPGDHVTARYRFEAPAAGGPLPDWWPGDTRPLVYVTFGSVAAGLGLFPGFYAAVAAALGALPVRVLMTTGDAGDPDALGPLPANVHVERWWPQDAVMPHASAMVGHGGYGTTLAGLAAGVPMVVVPLFADQPDNAAAVDATGAGIALPGGPAAVGALAGAVERVLDGGHHEAAARVAAEMAALPPAAAAVPLLEAHAGAVPRK